MALTKKKKERKKLYCLTKLSSLGFQFTYDH